jgi:arylsulfatase A-like enzyme
VPLIVCIPGVTEEPVVDSTNLVSGLDILPTLCDFAGVKAPANAAFEGSSLRPLIERKPAAWRDHLVVEMGQNNDARMVRTDRYKYIAYATGENREQLFDMQSDPGETMNLVGEASVQATLEEHRRLLKEWIERTKDAFGKKIEPSPRKAEDRKAKRAKKDSAKAPRSTEEDEE